MSCAVQRRTWITQTSPTSRIAGTSTVRDHSQTSGRAKPSSTFLSRNLHRVQWACSKPRGPPLVHDHAHIEDLVSPSRVRSADRLLYQVTRLVGFMVESVWNRGSRFRSAWDDWLIATDEKSIRKWVHASWGCVTPPLRLCSDIHGHG